MSSQIGDTCAPGVEEAGAVIVNGSSRIRLGGLWPEDIARMMAMNSLTTAWNLMATITGLSLSGGGEVRIASCDDCVGACKKDEICSSFWPSDSLENEILEQELRP